MGRAARRFADDDETAWSFTVPKPGRRLWEYLAIGGLIVSVLTMILLIGQTDIAGYAGLVMLLLLAAVAWLAEVELTAKPYTSRVAPDTVPGPAPVPSAH